MTDDTPRLAQRRGLPDHEARIGVLSDALKSIAKNTCCNNCREAANVARSALASYVGLAREPAAALAPSNGAVEADETDHIDWDILAEERLGQRPRSEHGRHIPQTSPAPGNDSGSHSAHRIADAIYSTPGLYLSPADSKKAANAVIAALAPSNGAVEARVPKVRTSHHRNKEEAARLQALVDERYASEAAPSPAALDPVTVERCAKWHDTRAHDTPDVFEAELHKVSAKAIRALIGQPSGESK
jgi:hypothetical protein